MYKMMIFSYTRPRVGVIPAFEHGEIQGDPTFIDGPNVCFMHSRKFPYIVFKVFVYFMVD